MRRSSNPETKSARNVRMSFWKPKAMRPKRLDRRLVFVILFAMLGSILLIATRAASPVVNLEAERAQRAGSTSTAADSTASNGSFLQFGPASDQPPQLTGNWRKVFEDDFNNATTSLQEIWEVKGSVQVANGLMTLVTGTPTNGQWSIVSTAGPRSSTEPNYRRMKAWREGYFETRLRFSESDWAWPAFWLFSAAKTEAWPGENCPPGGHFNAEWDIMENGVQNGWRERPARDWFFTNVHRNTTDNTADGYCATPDTTNAYAKSFAGITNLADWHVWGGRWIGNELCTYLDNKQIHCTTAYDTMSQPMELHLDIAFLRNCPAEWCGPRPANLEMQVDWVRVWQR